MRNCYAPSQSQKAAEAAFPHLSTDQRPAIMLEMIPLVTPISR
ncbi:hypothetical protein ACVIDN_002326 [Rhizobium brockwellii]